MNTLAPSFLIGSSSYLQVTTTSITSQTCTKFGYVGPRTAELATLGWTVWKNPHRLKWEKSCEHSSFFIFESIILIFAGNRVMHESLDEFKFWPDTTTNSRVICPYASEKLMYNVVNTLALLFLITSFSYWQVTRTSITSRMSSKFGQIGPRTAESKLHLSVWKIPIDL